LALVDRVKYDAEDDDLLVWKFPSEELKLGTQVIVNQSQQAIFVKGGEALDAFGPGTHTLSTGNIPVLNKILNLPFGGATPFTAEIWYINTTVKRDLKWGTPNPIPLLDQVIGFPISLRAFGKWGVRVADSRSFVAQLVGSQIDADSDKVHAYFIGEIIQKLSHVLSNAIIGNQLSVLNISTALNELSELVSDSVASEFSRFGVEVVNFNIENINIPEDELEKIQSVFAKKMEAEQLSQVQVGSGYTAIKTFETLKAAAENTSEGAGNVGGLLGAGIGLGAGLPIGQQLGQQMNVSPSNQGSSSNSPKERLAALQELFDEGLITESEFNQRREEILRDI
jgi:membrane protease subunit (stomatin/prohibitin family)